MRCTFPLHFAAISSPLLAFPFMYCWLHVETPTHPILCGLALAGRWCFWWMEWCYALCAPVCGIIIRCHRVCYCSIENILRDFPISITHTCHSRRLHRISSIKQPFQQRNETYPAKKYWIVFAIETIEKFNAVLIPLSHQPFTDKNHSWFSAASSVIAMDMIIILFTCSSLWTTTRFSSVRTIKPNVTVRLMRVQQSGAEWTVSRFSLTLYSSAWTIHLPSAEDKVASSP